MNGPAKKVHDTNEMMRRRNQRVTDQLLEELDAGRFDSALTERIVATPSAFPRLLRACYRALAQQRDETRADIDAALPHARDNPVVELTAGMLLLSLGQRERAIELLERAATRSPSAATRVEQLRAEADEHGPSPELDEARIEQAKRLLLRALATYTGPRRV